MSDPFKEFLEELERRRGTGTQGDSGAEPESGAPSPRSRARRPGGGTPRGARPPFKLGFRTLFLPILLTWLALSQVIEPFALFLQNQQPSANFLWFWQTNPGGSFAGIYKLSHVALTDAAILAFLTVLAMRITWWEAAKAENSEHVYSEMLSAVETYLSDYR